MAPQPNLLAQRQQISPQQAAAISKNRKMSFLQGLSRIMASRNAPLPSSISGVEAAYDPNTSPWRDFEPASELGGVKLAGKDIDLYKLWCLVFSAGGAGRVQQQGAWTNIAQQFDLPQQLPHPQEDGNTLTAVALAKLYIKVLGAFEEFYYRGMSDTQRQAMAQQGRLPIPASSLHGHNISPPGSAGNLAQNQPSAGADATAHPPSFGVTSSENELDAEARKRKVEESAGSNDDNNGKRRKTDSGSPELSTNTSETAPHPRMSAPPTSNTRVKARRKIEYLPLSREIETAGGRDVSAIQNELQRLTRGQHLRDIHDWGKVHVEALLMSIRSRLSVELSYGLTTLVILSTMRSQGHDTGFLITQCGDLLDEVLDLLQDLSFPNGTDVDTRSGNDEVITNRRLVGLAHEEVSTPFAAEKKQSDYDPSIQGPMQRRADLIRLILNILRNLSAVTDNQAFMAHHPLLVDLLLRLTSMQISEGHPPAAASDALLLPDLIVVRKDVLNILVNLGRVIALAPASSHTDTSPSSAAPERRARLIFELVSSYLIDPSEAVGPFTWVVQSGAPMTPSTRAPLLPDAALEVFTQISHPDVNRKVISRAVPLRQQWSLFEALVYRLPSSDNDYKVLMTREESWISYLEKLVLGLYSLAFLMPPELKKRVKEDRGLSFPKVMMRFVKKIMTGGPQQMDFRMHFATCARRSVETMKVIDDGEDSFNVDQPSIAPLSFGVGYGEAADSKVEKGDGLLGGHEDELLWSVMLQREVDEVMFSELESLARVEKEIRVH
ncbi:uncharacterized protein FOMMEDRAFT_19453 [Fomitiporia mediterranea MF3/22]|uniref:uncharacterized protein n=1 Tax=Fomitiporia mediterranea (strain MF3/22) TaxID=694068 RepID=UPI0004407F0E|nr:uncharacterized protein FOMMEDRAFT_19453 [Fomitiporia mediterranea MF3/22]EJD04184.1 hypothetical protein FOMMEDRAFT_19453 [Fomitiporia mediterranea MF3/22]